MFGKALSSRRKCVGAVTTAICEQRPGFISFPSSRDEINYAKQGFKQTVNITGIIRLIDDFRIHTNGQGGNYAQYPSTAKATASIECRSLIQSIPDYTDCKRQYVVSS